MGSGIAGRDVVSQIKLFPNLGYHVVGFIDDNIQKQGKKISGIVVLGGKDRIVQLIKRHTVDEVIIAIPSAHGDDISTVIKICSETKTPFKIVPRVKEIIEGKAYISNIRPVEIQDLLGRPVVKADVKELSKFLTQKTIFITGAAGSIGSELTRQVCAFKPRKILLYDLWENGIFQLKEELSKSYAKKNIHYIIGNIQDEKKVRRLFKQHKPDIVFHAAAFKHVPLMEEHIDEAIKNNIFGTSTVLEASLDTNVKKFIFVSTDKAANPTSIMGMTKLVAESLTQHANGKTKCMIVRFGNVLDSQGSVIPTFKAQIQTGGPVTVTDAKMTRFFMTIPEASQLILLASQIGNGGELFVLNMGKPVKIVDLAKNLIRLSGMVPEKDIKIIYTGIRKGEKMHEQLFTRKEEVTATKKEKIFITRSHPISKTKLLTSLPMLMRFTEEGNLPKLRKKLITLVKSG